MSRYEGQCFTTNSWGELKILQYVNSKYVVVKFINTGYECITQMDKILKGVVKDRMCPTVLGVGIVGATKIQVNNEIPYVYNLWRGMLKRCYDLNFRKDHTTYKSSTVSDNFKYFPYFKEWCEAQIGYNSVDENLKVFQLDKDILFKGNKLYSEDTCVFVPPEINKLLTHKRTNKGDYVIGVSFDRNLKKYVSKVNRNGKYEHLGVFSNEMDAFLAYKAAKESHIKYLANKWKDQIDYRVYEALMGWEIEITD